MKKAIMLIVCMLTAAVSQIIAQPVNRMGLNTPGVQQLIIQYGDELNLTDTQKSDLIALQIEHRNQFRADGPMRRGDRRDFRKDRDGRRGDRGQGFRNANPEFMQARFETRMEMRQEVLDILTDDQEELLQSKLVEQAEKAHEFRTFRHEYIINEAGIEGDKTEQVFNLLNAQSANRLELAKQRISNPEETNKELWADHFKKMRDTDDELRSILTVDEYESLRKNIGFANSPRHRQGRGARGRSR